MNQCSWGGFSASMLSAQHSSYFSSCYSPFIFLLEPADSLSPPPPPPPPAGGKPQRIKIVINLLLPRAWILYGMLLWEILHSLYLQLHKYIKRTSSKKDLWSQRNYLGDYLTLLLRGYLSSGCICIEASLGWTHSYLQNRETKCSRMRIVFVSSHSVDTHPTVTSLGTPSSGTSRQPKHSSLPSSYCQQRGWLLIRVSTNNTTPQQSELFQITEAPHWKSDSRQFSDSSSLNVICLFHSNLIISVFRTTHQDIWELHLRLWETPTDFPHHFLPDLKDRLVAGPEDFTL